MDPVGLRSYNILASIPQDQIPDKQLHNNILQQNDKIIKSNIQNERIKDILH